MQNNNNSQFLLNDLDAKGVVKIYNSNLSEEKFVQAMTMQYFDLLMLIQQEKLNQLQKEQKILEKYIQMQQDISFWIDTQKSENCVQEIEDIDNQIICQQKIIQECTQSIQKQHDLIAKKMDVYNTLENEIEKNTWKIKNLDLSIKKQQTELKKENTNNIEQPLENDINKQIMQLDALYAKNQLLRQEQKTQSDANFIYQKAIKTSNTLIAAAQLKIAQLTSKKQLLQSIAQKQAEIETFKSANQCLQNFQDQSVQGIQDAIDDKKKQINVYDNQLKERNVMLKQFQDSMKVYHNEFAKFAGEGKTINLGANNMLEKIEKILHNLKQCMLGLMNSRYTKEEYQSKNAKFVEKVIEERKCRSSSVDKSNNLI